MVTFATRSGHVSYVEKVVAPYDWDDIIRTVIFLQTERDIILQYSQILPMETYRMSVEPTNSQNLPMPDTGMTVRTSSKRDF